MMKTNKRQKSILIALGYNAEDIPNIEKGITKTIYRKNNNRISRKEVIKEIGENIFFAVVARSIFHYNSGTEDIDFDSSLLYKNNPTPHIY